MCLLKLIYWNVCVSVCFYQTANHASWPPANLTKCAKHNVHTHAKKTKKKYSNFTTSTHTQKLPNPTHTAIRKSHTRQHHTCTHTHGTLHTQNQSNTGTHTRSDTHTPNRHKQKQNICWHCDVCVVRANLSAYICMFHCDCFWLFFFLALLQLNSLLVPAPAAAKPTVPAPAAAKLTAQHQVSAYVSQCLCRNFSVWFCSRALVLILIRLGA